MNSHTHSDDAASIPPTVYAQLEALREADIVDLDTGLLHGLEFFGFEEATKWVRRNPVLLCDWLAGDLEPTNPDAVEQIDAEELAASAPTPRTHTRTDGNNPFEQQLLRYLNNIRHISPPEEVYYTRGSWRDVAHLTDEELALAEKFKTAVEREPDQLIENILSITEVEGNTHDVAFGFGYTTTRRINYPAEHIWVELNEKVVEVKLPDGPVPNSCESYLGVSVPLEIVRIITMENKQSNLLEEIVLGIHHQAKELADGIPISGRRR